MKYKDVPLFAEDTFKRVSTIRSLWQILSAFWDIYDYDILLHVLKIINCEKANKIFDVFLLKIDPAVIDDVDLVIYYKEYERQGFTKPLLRVKLKIESYNHHNKKEVHRALSKLFNLEQFALRLKGIKQGCVELIYEVSTQLKSYLLSCKVMGSDVHYLDSCGITRLQIDDMEMKFSSYTLNVKVCSYVAIYVPLAECYVAGN